MPLEKINHAFELMHEGRSIRSVIKAFDGRKRMTQNFKATGRCRCATNPVQFEYTKQPYEVHYCLCTDCTDTCGGALAIIAVVEKAAFKIRQNEKKIRNFDTKPTCHRRYCAECGCHMFLYVDAFPDFVLVHVPTLHRNAHVGANPDRWVFTKSKHPMITIPEDGLPRHDGWAGTASPNV